MYILLIMNEQIHQPNTAQLAEIEATCACANVRKAARAVTQLFDEVLQPTGLRSTQFTLLVAVARLGEAPVTRLAERGRQALASALPYWEQAQHQVVERLGHEQWQALRASLQATMTLAQPL